MSDILPPLDSWIRGGEGRGYKASDLQLGSTLFSEDASLVYAAVVVFII